MVNVIMVQVKILKRRWGRHRSDLKSNRHNNVFLQRIWNKYGDVFEFEIVELCDVNILLQI